jgi:hypothetical protein
MTNIQQAIEAYQYLHQALFAPHFIEGKEGEEHPSWARYKSQDSVRPFHSLKISFRNALTHLSLANGRMEDWYVQNHLFDIKETSGAILQKLNTADGKASLTRRWQNGHSQEPIQLDMERLRASVQNLQQFAAQNLSPQYITTRPKFTRNVELM